MFLTVYRLFTPNIDKIKTLCLQRSINSRYFTARSFNSILNSKFFFFSSTGLVLYSTSLNFNSKFMSELLNIYSGFSVSAFLFNGFFLNFYSFTFEDFFAVLNTAMVSL